ncbi:DUF2515 family protein [Peribacillus sp. NPDC006672]|uniref:DUF2515 family protein n=1 Tax=Peribacillus sp. NPDC006672 TaxID=3390606 RepID=UPI003D027363
MPYTKRAFLPKESALVKSVRTEADAFPQLLLNEHSKQQELPIGKYFPAFHISRFMAPIWESSIEEPHLPLLTTSLIINEQRIGSRMKAS